MRWLHEHRKERKKKVPKEKTCNAVSSSGKKAKGPHDLDHQASCGPFDGNPFHLYNKV